MSKKTIQMNISLSQTAIRNWVKKNASIDVKGVTTSDICIMIEVYLI